jgi:hypothetical protein
MSADTKTATVDTMAILQHVKDEIDAGAVRFFVAFANDKPDDWDSPGIIFDPNLTRYELVKLAAFALRLAGEGDLGRQALELVKVEDERRWRIASLNELKASAPPVEVGAA